jgi:tetratricopeptide (TPR) repeat protein
VPSYPNELSPREQRHEYYSNIQLGKDVSEQTAILNRQTKEMVSAHLESANGIIASQERIMEGIDAVSFGVDRIEKGIYELKSAFEWGISEVVWQIELNRTVLKDIVEILMAPLDTQAKERRKRAEKAYWNDLTDDAEEEFLASERLNKFDFSIHMSLGMIYQFRKIDKGKALEYFAKASRYAKPESNFFASYAMLHEALMHFELGRPDEAEKICGEAASLSPTFSEATYQHAQYNAQLGNGVLALACLEEAILMDKIYCLKVRADEMFDPIRSAVDGLLDSIREREKEKACLAYTQLEEIANIVDPIAIQVANDALVDRPDWMFRSKQLSDCREQVKTLIERGSYYDFLDVNSMAPSISGKHKSLFEEVRSNIGTLIEERLKSISDSLKKCKEDLSETLLMLGYLAYMGTSIVPALGSYLGAEDWEWRISSFLTFGIPGIGQVASICCWYGSIFDPDMGSWGKGAGWSSLLACLFSVVLYFFRVNYHKRECGVLVDDDNGVIDVLRNYKGVLDKAANAVTQA